MQFNHTTSALSAAFDDRNLVSNAGLVPVMRLAERAGLSALSQKHLTVPTDKGANAGAKGSAFNVDAAFQPTILREYTSVTNDTYANPDQVAT